MKIIELAINGNKDFFNIFIKKYNNIIYRKLTKVLEFFKYFDDVINERDERVSIKIDNKQITSKDFILINLIDIQSVIDEIKYKKGSILYEYSNIIIENIDYEITLEINQFLENVFQNIKTNFCFDSHLSFDSNIIKLFNSQSVFIPIIDVSEIEIKIESMLNFILKEKLDKKLIIFINSDLLNINLNNNENAIIFDISSTKEISEYNLIFSKSFDNLDQELLLNEIKLNWPINYNDNDIKANLQRYFNNFFNLDVVATDDLSILIISRILNKFLNLKQVLIYNEDKIENIVKSFLNSF